MGHLINPITYRLGKTKFWNFTWSNITKKNYKHLLFEDINLNKFLKWLFSILSWTKVGVFIHDFALIKNFNTVDVSIYFFLNKLNFSSLFKKTLFKISIKNNFLNFFLLFLSNRKFFSLNYFLNKRKKLKIGKKFLIKNKKKKIYKRKKILKLFLKSNYNKKKKKYNKKKNWLNIYLFNYCFFSFKKNKILKFNYLTFFNSIIFSSFKKLNTFSITRYNFDKNFLIEKNFQSRYLNYNFFFRLLTFFLTFFLKKVFNYKNFFFNFFQKNSNFLNAKAIKRFVNFNMQKNRSKVAQVIKRVFKKTKRKFFILGIKIGFFGRYEKKLRNKSVWQIRGSLSPSNINTPITHKNFCILLKQGLCGVKISFLSKLKKNEIFKKKTFINKSFKIR